MTYRGPIPSVDVPVVALTDYILQHWPQYGSRIAIIEASTDRRITSDELIQLVRRTATGLARCGFDKGDVPEATAENKIQPVSHRHVAGPPQPRSPLRSRR